MSRPALAFALATALALPAHAALLDSPPAFAGTGANVQCLARNADTKAHEVSATIFDAVGAVIAGPASTEVLPGATVDLANTGGPTVGYVICRFEGLSRKVKGWITVIDPGGTRVMLPAGK